MTRVTLNELEIDNRDSTTTWLHIQDKDVDTIELTLDDLFALIRNMIENTERFAFDEESKS
jgi:hypothetical protein